MSVEVKPPVANGQPESNRSDRKPVNNLLGRFKDEFEKVGKNVTVRLAFPGWNRNLWIEYGVVQADDFAKKVELSQSDIDANVGFLADACRGIYLRDESGKPVELDYNDESVGFDERLAELLGIEATTAREVLLWLVKDNTIALNSHSIEVLNWMRDTSQEVDGGFLGESLS